MVEEEGEGEEGEGEEREGEERKKPEPVSGFNFVMQAGRLEA